jgi:hypothetical protein
LIGLEKGDGGKSLTVSAVASIKDNNTIFFGSGSRVADPDAFKGTFSAALDGIDAALPPDLALDQAAPDVDPCF